MNFTKLSYMLFMMMSTTLTLSSNNWLGMWMGMEMNLLSFIPLIYKINDKNSAQGMMIYYLTQSIGSIIMLFFILNYMMSITPLIIKEYMKLPIIMGIMIKIGLPPFHNWMPEMMSMMSWMPCMMLMTWQKLAPMFTLSNMMMKSTTINIIIMFTSMIGALGGLNTTSLRKIMAFSSISHLSWMLMYMFMSIEWYKYMMIYSIINLMMCITFMTTNSYFFNQLNNKMSMMGKYLMVVNLFSMGGLPPFLGFLPKWMVMQTMINNNMFFIMMWMIMMSLLTLFYYIQMISSLMMNYYYTNQWMMNMNNKSFTIMTWMNLKLPILLTMSF
uniref:NADH-ubiquinone oxidoreductase chain 2 n=1 Tax=Kleidocerys resedae resedae TaxID=1503485 RepID=A0A060BD64_9HEMI|nr:NADH dehydrogenase subunit 2 [Kleidocerys resedae resedae]